VRQCQELSGNFRRTGAKLKVLSDAIHWSEVRLEVLRLVLEHHGFRREDNAMVLSPSVLRAVLEDVLFATSKNKNVDVEMGTELTACFLWQTFDRHRTASLTLLQAKTALAVLSKAFPSELFAFLAAEAADHDGQVGPRRLKPMLEALKMLMEALGEDVSYEFKDKRLNQVEAEEWMKSKMGWATHLARFRASLHGDCQFLFIYFIFFAFN
jgi:EF hand